MSLSFEGCRVALLGTLDSKGDEYEYARDLIKQWGGVPTLIDFGLIGPPRVTPDITADEVCARAGSSRDYFSAAREGSDMRAKGLEVMTDGLKSVVKELYETGQLDCVFGMGGSGGSSVISAVMRTLPVGVPKFLVSTMASGDISGYVGESDLTVMHSVTDILGMNRLSRSVIGNACGAALGMAAAFRERPSSGAGTAETVGVSMFGVTTPCVRRVENLLAREGIETVVFHAVGSGGRALEKLTADDNLDGVIDVTTSELVDGEYGGLFGSSPDRLRASVRKRVPYVVVPGAMEVLNFSTVESIPDPYGPPKRSPIVHNTSVCAVRTDIRESAHLGAVMAERLEGGGERVTVVVPLRGFSNYSKPPDGPWIDQEADAAFIDALKRNLDPDIRLVEVDANINDPQFAEILVEEYLDVRARARAKKHEDES